MNWQRNHTIWVVQHTITKEVLVVYDRLFLAQEYIADHPSTMWTRMKVNHEGG